MGTMEIQKQRLIKKCKIVLGENFCPDFIYEDVDFTKPSTIKEAYKLFESTNLDEAEKYEAGKYYAKFGGRVVGPYDTEKDAYHDTKGDVEWIKKGKDINEFTEAKDGYIGKTVVYATKDTSGGGTTSSIAKSKVVKYDKKYGVLTLADGGKVNIKLHQRKNKKLYWKKDFYIESTEIDEAKQYVVIDKRGKVVSSRPMSTSAALDHYDSLGGNAKGYKVVATDDKRIKESSEVEEAKGVLEESTLNYARTLKAIEKERKTKNISDEDKETLGKIAKLMASLKEEAKNATVRKLRQMLFKIDSNAADKFRRELFNIDKQDSPATSAQIKKAKKIIGNRFGKDAFVQLEAKTDKQHDIESTEIEESSAAQRKLKTSNKLSSAEYEKFSKLKAFNDKDWKWNSKEGLYHRVNKEIELEAKTDKQQEIESLENMIKNPDPKRFKQYGGKDKYLKMLNTKLAKLKAYKKYVMERSVPKYEIYHKTYSDAMTAALSFAEDSGYEVDADDWFNQVTSGPRKPSKDKVNTFSIILLKNDKEQKKRLQIQVTNLGTSGRPFELNAYIA